MIIVRAIKYNSHDCLTSSYWAVSFYMNLINTNRLSFGHKSIENIFTEVFSFNNHFFLLWMALGIECCQSKGLTPYNVHIEGSYCMMLFGHQSDAPHIPNNCYYSHHLSTTEKITYANLSNPIIIPTTW